MEAVVCRRREPKWRGGDEDKVYHVCSAAIRDSETRFSEASCRFKREPRLIRRIHLIVTAVDVLAELAGRGDWNG